jgi:hypothetical protein
MNRWRVGEDRGSKEMDGCPLTLATLVDLFCTDVSAADMYIELKQDSLRKVWITNQLSRIA